jgi:hypothetical protein
VPLPINDQLGIPLTGDESMEKKPELIVKLFAGDTLVDQSVDAALWQRVLSEIRGIAPVRPPAPMVDAVLGADVGNADAAITAFAKSVELTPDEIVGSLDPTSQSPFIRLNSHDWEALKRNTPSKGPGSVGPSVLAATALVLWQRHGGIGDITLPTVRASISTIDLDDPNAGRSIGNCDWLQNRSNRITLNPSRLSAARRLLRAYCRREPLAEVR